MKLYRENMLNLFRRKKLAEKVLVLNAVPHTEVAFKSLFANGTSDFIKSLGFTEGMAAEVLWKKYQSTARQLTRSLKKFAGMGAHVVPDMTMDDMCRMADGYDIVVIIAHHADKGDEIEIGGELVDSRSFIEAFPLGMKGIVDVTSCFSAYLLPKLKLRNPECRFIGIETATTLPLRLLLLEETLSELIKTSKIDYKEALGRVVGRLTGLSSDNCVFEDSLVHEHQEPRRSEKGTTRDPESDGPLNTRPESVYLGAENLNSTVFAPASVRKGDDFMVQIFIHADADKDEVTLTATMVDDSAEERNSKAISFHLEDGDKVDFQLVQMPKPTSDFEVEDEVKGFVWSGSSASVEFCVSVSPECAKSAFIGKIKMAVNKQPVGDMLFKTAILESGVSGRRCASFEFVENDPASRAAVAEVSLIEHLKKVRKELADNASGATAQDLEICDKCIELLGSPRRRKNDILKVFISSTSDMKRYRMVLKEQVDFCRMYADMYELWGQGNDYPRDVCCEHVVDSDIFVCILGGNYGFVEPSWGLSMTEIEYRMAECCRIPILIYIDNNWRSIVSERKTNPEDASGAKAQEALIDELRINRMVHFFNDENKLALQALAELLTLKNKVLYGTEKDSIF